MKTGQRSPNGRRPGFFMKLEIWVERYTQRKALMQLDDTMLKDIGISRAKAEAEANKPFWIK
ncbi:hypothetical protein BOW51_07600 [Solemya velesiana gill symbiont]|uniref:YjiS-like domain-containing protein n=1 Tax=Solemya velesiana gill symbiont TaxID=1918948 RepID=A0A1T2KU18_9GAMM|nr:hypothetical protein BOW51_07600 [Solemya velesiana gill symbiont]